MVRFLVCFCVVILRFKLHFHALLFFTFLAFVVWVCVHVVGVVSCVGVHVRKNITLMFWLFPRWCLLSHALYR